MTPQKTSTSLYPNRQRQQILKKEEVLAANFTHTLKIKNSPLDISGHSSLLLGVGLLLVKRTLGRRRLVIIALVLEDILVGVGIILVKPDRGLVEHVLVAVDVVRVKIAQVVVLFLSTWSVSFLLSWPKMSDGLMWCILSQGEQMIYE